MAKDYQTTNCFVCYEEAIIFSGHVHKDEKTVSLGWCEEHASTRLPTVPVSAPTACLGCYGEWKKDFGLKETIY